MPVLWVQRTWATRLGAPSSTTARDIDAGEATSYNRTCERGLWERHLKARFCWPTLTVRCGGAFAAARAAYL